MASGLNPEIDDSGFTEDVETAACPSCSKNLAVSFSFEVKPHADALSNFTLSQTRHNRLLFLKLRSALGVYAAIFARSVSKSLPKYSLNHIPPGFRRILIPVVTGNQMYWSYGIIPVSAEYY